MIPTVSFHSIIVEFILRLRRITNQFISKSKEEAKRLGASGYIVKPLKLNNPASMDAFNLLLNLMNM